MIEKLKYYGFRVSVLSWFKSFLSNRQQFVMIDDAKSPTKNVPVGTAQGSSISALLFILFTMISLWYKIVLNALWSQTILAYFVLGKI